MYKHILIPTDGSELSNNAIHHGITLAKAVNAEVTGITVTTSVSSTSGTTSCSMDLWKR